MSWIFVTFKKLFKVKNKKEEECRVIPNAKDACVRGRARSCLFLPWGFALKKHVVVFYDYLSTSCVAVPLL